jgi:Na+/proline symporter
MSKHSHREQEHNDGSYVVKKSRKSSIFAFVVCFLIAFVIWAYTMSYGEKTPEIDVDNTTEQTA